MLIVLLNVLHYRLNICNHCKILQNCILLFCPEKLCKHRFRMWKLRWYELNLAMAAIFHSIKSNDFMAAPRQHLTWPDICVRLEPDHLFHNQRPGWLRVMSCHVTSCKVITTAPSLCLQAQTFRLSPLYVSMGHMVCLRNSRNLQALVLIRG